MRTVLAVMTGALLLAGCASDTTTPAGPVAKPDALLEKTVQREDGSTVSLADLTKDGPVVLYLIKEHCSANSRAIPHINKLYGSFGEKARFVGVATVTPDRLEAWKKEFGITFPVTLDPDKTVIDAFGIRYSQTALVLNPDGKPGARHDGYGIESLTALNKTIAEVSKVPVPEVDLSAAPTVPSYG